MDRQLDRTQDEGPSGAEADSSSCSPGRCQGPRGAEALQRRERPGACSLEGLEASLPSDRSESALG